MFRIITIPFDHEKGVFLEDELNSFSLNKRLKSYKAEFFVKDEVPYWSVFFEYEQVLTDEGNKGTDNVHGLNDGEKLLLQRLREWRGEKASAQGVPVYIVATNRELMDMVRSAPRTIESLKSIKGYGKKKVEKYGREIIAMIKSFYEEK